LVGKLPHEEKVILPQRRLTFVVWAVLGMLRVLPALGDTAR
jgi:hypothetical protein